MKWVNELNSTTLHILVGCGLSIVFVGISLIGALAGHEIPETTLLAIGTFILTYSGVATTGFIAKRVTDSDYVTAKRTTTSIAAVAETPSPVAPAAAVASAAKEGP